MPQVAPLQGRSPKARQGAECKVLGGWATARTQPRARKRATCRSFSSICPLPESPSMPWKPLIATQVHQNTRTATRQSNLFGGRACRPSTSAQGTAVNTVDGTLGSPPGPLLSAGRSSTGGAFTLRSVSVLLDSRWELIASACKRIC